MDDFRLDRSIERLLNPKAMWWFLSKPGPLIQEGEYLEIIAHKAALTIIAVLKNVRARGHQFGDVK